MYEPAQRTCQNCKIQFPIESDDFAFYEKIQVPPPTWCPECRMIRRMVFRNDRMLYKRECDKCGEVKVMMYPNDVTFPVYCFACWWGDGWDPKTYGIDYDYSKSFFDQFLEMRNSVPRCGVVKSGNMINSEYTNRVTEIRDSYLIFGTSRAENCRYGVWFNDTRDSMDCYVAVKSQRCYECIDVYQCYNLKYSQECIECADSTYLYNCRNCTNCLGCVNLRNKSYCILNQQYTKEEYQIRSLEFTVEQYIELKNKQPMPAITSHQCTNVSGNWLKNSKNALQSFHCENCEDIKYCFRLYDVKDSMDMTTYGQGAQNIYEGVNIGMQCADLKFVSECWNQLLEAEYCMNCHSSQNLFGCNGLRKARYCILNKQYGREEYFTEVLKIKKQMIDAKEYGEFFPMALSPHAYNETIAQEFFPLTQEQAAIKGYRWRDMEEKNYQIGGDVVSCGHGGKCMQLCTKAFRITSEDVEFYKMMGVSAPNLCPNCRHFERLAKRNPIKLWHRLCMCTQSHPHHTERCTNEFETSYSPDRKEIIYCEKCYQAEVV